MILEHDQSKDFPQQWKKNQQQEKAAHMDCPEGSIMEGNYKRSGEDYGHFIQNSLLL